MIEHVYRRAAAARSITSVIVATDDERIHRAVLGFGGESRMTSAAHQSGTDRVAEIAAQLSCDLIVNVQGDEPLIEPAMIDEVVFPFSADASLLMCTLRRRIDDLTEVDNPNVTKVVVDRAEFALYFSRAPIPFVRQGCPPQHARFVLPIRQRFDHSVGLLRGARSDGGCRISPPSTLPNPVKRGPRPLLQIRQGTKFSF